MAALNVTITPEQRLEATRRAIEQRLRGIARELDQMAADTLRLFPGTSDRCHEIAERLRAASNVIGTQRGGRI